MALFNITSNDTLTLNGHVFNDLAADDVTVINIPNELMNRKTGKNGNTVLAANAQGYNADLMIRVMRGSPDDQFLLGFIAATPDDFPSTQLLNGTFVKRLGDGQGNVTSDTYTLSGGAVAKIPDGKENTSGDTEQAIAVYKIIFANGQRSIG